MSDIIFVIGGCRSGKSRQALELAEKLPAQNHIFVATCVPYDDEMKDRVKRHQDDRGEHWQTVEEPILLSEVLENYTSPENVVLIDCLTLWVNNILMDMSTPDMNRIDHHIQKLVQSLALSPGTVILVSNEVGSGIVPENNLARFFRDATGFTNQSIAAVATSVIWMVAGIPVKIK